jgi:hypothetical protein
VGLSDQDKKVIGKRLELLETITGLQGQELAEQFATTKQKWSHYKVGRVELPIPLARAIRDKYGCTLDWLFIGDESNLRADFEAKLRAARRGMTGPFHPARTALAFQHVAAA